MELGQYGWNRQVKMFQQHAVFLERPVPAISNYGALNIGDAPFDGLSQGHFAGNDTGTYLAINSTSAFNGSLIRCQSVGVDLFYVDKAGLVGLAAITDVAQTHSYLHMGNTTDTIFIGTRFAGNRGLVIQGSVSQSVDLQQWQDSSNNVLAKIDASGHMNLAATPTCALAAWGGGD